MMGGVRLTERLRRVDGRAKPVVLAFVRADVVAPHLVDDLQGFLEAFEPLGQRRERDAERGVLLFVPGGSDSEHCSAAG
jgi:hypothetical protein